MAELEKPDYKFWNKLDNWSFKDAALLLHGMEPFKYKAVRFSTTKVPQEPELREPHKTFIILKDANTQQPRPFRDNLVSPSFIMAVAIQKELPIPNELVKLFEERDKKAQEQHNKDVVASTNQQTQNSSIANKELSTRERRSLLKAIGIMAFLLTDDPKRTSQFRLNDRANAYQISQAVLDKAHHLGLEPEGIKSLNRKIKEALELLVEEGFEKSL